MEIKGSTIEQLDKSKPRSRCRKWRLWVTTEQGRKSRRFSGTYTEASEALESLVSELSIQMPGSGTFASYAQSWLSWRKGTGELSSGTIANNTREVNALLRSPLAAMRMDSITPQDCREALLWVKQNPQRASGELSNTTMNKICITLGTIFAQADDDGRIAKNPMAKVRAPKPDTKEKDALSPGELQLFVNRLDGLEVDGRVMALYLMALLGLRRSEAIAIADGSIAGGFADVLCSVDELTGGIKGTKTKAGTRRIPVPERLEEPLGRWRAERRRRGFADSETLCCNSAGGIMRAQNLQKWWNETRDGLGCPGMTLHQLRHSNLSMVARHMSPYDLQRYAGWSSIEPARVYIHENIDAMAKGISDAWNCIEIESDAPLTHH